MMQWKDSSECFQIKYVKVMDKWYLVICTNKGCQIWNHNGTRQLTYVESKKKQAEGKANFFSCVAVGYDKSDGKDFIAVATSLGEIYSVFTNGASFVKDFGFQIPDETPITAMSGDARSKTLAVGTATGSVLVFECENQGEWRILHTIESTQEIPVTSMGTLMRGDNIYVVGFANGMVKLIHPSGFVACELSAHSRCLNSLACHPSKSVFATCSDDTFMHIFEVSGDKLDRLDVNLLISSRVNDYQLCGVVFGGESNSTVVATPYDFKTIVVWNNII